MTLWAAALALAVWLGLTGLADPRVVDTPPRLVLVAGTSTARDVPALRAALAAAGMSAGGAAWQFTAVDGARDPSTPADAAVEVRAEDARGLGNLSADVRLARIGGEAAIVLDVPDRGRLTDLIALPVADRRLQDYARRVGAELRGRRLRRGEARLELQWILAAHPRGEAAPDVQPPHVEMPRLPLRRAARPPSGG